jgi:protein-tyrosine phosphatase
MTSDRPAPRRATRILFVCLGNICRSPTAEGVLRHLLAREAPQLAVEVDSAGTGDYHLGSPPDARSQRAALRRGIDLSALRARQVSARDFMRFDWLLAMDSANLQVLRAMRPAGSPARLGLFMDFAPEPHPPEVPDPYLGEESDFELVLDLTAAAARGLMRSLQQRSQQPIEAAGEGDGNRQGEHPRHQ